MSNTGRAKKRISITTKVLLLITAILALQSVFLLTLFGLLEDSERLLQDQRRARAVDALCAKFSSDMQTASVTLFRQLQKVGAPLESYRETQRQLPRDFESLKQLLGDEGKQRDELKDLEASVYEALELTEKTPLTAPHTSPERKRSDSDTMMHRLYALRLIDLSRSMSAQIDRLEQLYRQQAETKEQNLASLSDNLFYLSVLLGLAVNIVAVLLLYFFFVRGLQRRLAVIAQNTVNLSSGKSLLAPVGGDDEISDLDRSFREMTLGLEHFKTKETAILEHAASFICSLDARSTFVGVPSASSAMWGYQPDDLLGRRFNSIVMPETLEVTTEALNALTDRGHGATFENRIRCSDGSYLTLSWTATMNKRKQIVCIGQDITQRKRMNDMIVASTERFATIVERMPVAVVSCDDQFAITSINAATTKMLQYTPDELAGNRLDQLMVDLPVKDPPGHDAFIEPVQVRLKRRDQTLLPAEYSLSSYTTKETPKLLACFKDISARVEIELAKRDFVSMISHDLRTPLMSLQGTLAVLSHLTEAEGTSQEAIAQADLTISRLVEFINDFLDLGKMEAGSSSLVLNGVGLDDLVGTIEEMSEPMLDAHHCTLKVTHTSGKIRLNVDEERLALALACLIEVITFCTPPNSVISLTAEVSGETLKISLTGEQCRIPQAVIETCKEGYALVDFGSAISSSGLRLALSRTIIAAHQGKLRAHSSAAGDRLECEVPI